MMVYSRMLPLSQISRELLAKIKMVATDIDDTLTIKGKLTTSVIDKLAKIREKGLSVILVTGRAAGWGQALVNYFSFVDYLIAENGLVLIDNRGVLKCLRDPESDLEGKLDASSEMIRDEYDLLFTHESCFSLLERTFIRPPHFTSSDIEKCNRIVNEGLEVVASSIHIHVRPDHINKGSALQYVLEEKYPSVNADNVITIGDSSSDGPLFEHFPISVGVANIAEYEEELGENLPLFIASRREGYGVVEVLDRILEFHGEKARS